MPITARRIEDQVVLRIPTHDDWGNTHCDHHMSIEAARTLLKQLAAPINPKSDALDNLTDAMVKDILRMTDQEILDGVLADGNDAEKQANRMRELFDRTATEVDLENSQL